jgi:phosphatidylglycerophosphate synthase
MTATTVSIDYAGNAAVASMVVGGMSVMERVLRDAARAGAGRAIVVGDAAALPRLPALAITVDVIPSGPPGAAAAEAAAIPGDTIAGVRISDEASRRRAERALLQTCRRPYDGIGDRYVIRSFSLPLTGLFARLGATPNQVTSANIVVGVSACVLAALGTRLGFALAGALMFVQVVLDSCDGELSRIRHMGSKFGMWLDNVSDDIIDNSFVACLGVGLGGVWMWIGIAFAVLRGMVALMIYRDVARAGKPGDVMAFKWWFDDAGDELAERYDTSTSVLSLVRALGRRDLYVLVWSAACLATFPIVALGLGVGVCGAYFGLGIAHVIVSGRRATPSD